MLFRKFTFVVPDFHSGVGSLSVAQVNFTISTPDGMGTTNVTDDNGNGAFDLLLTISLTRYVLILTNPFISVVGT